jgi:hypothetical protein
MRLTTPKSTVDDLAGNENLRSLKIVHETQKHLPYRVSFSEGKMKDKRCTECSDKEKYLKSKAHRRDKSYQYSDRNVGCLASKYFTQ